MRRWHPSYPRPIRGALALAGLASLTVGLVLLPAASSSAAGVTGVNARTKAHGGSAVTKQGNYLYDPATKQQYKSRSTVTVSQTSGLVNQVVQVSWANFTPSVTAFQQPWYAYNGGAPSSYSVMVAECKGINPAQPTDCSGASNAGVPIPRDQNGIVNTAYAITAGNTTGQVPFDVQTSAQNKPLGCDQHHPCSLVVVPGQGGIPGNCGSHGNDLGPNGNAAPFQTFKPSTDACSWGDRIVIPLHFAPVPTGCPLRNPVFSSSGSPMLANAMQQWRTGLCAGQHGLTIAYQPQNGEPLAVSQTVSGASDVAFTTRPASAQGVSTGGRPFVYAPVAVSAVSIAYWIDNNNTGQPLFGLKLNQRMLAKLLTTSYASSFLDDKGVKGNPYSMFAINPGGDTEFQRVDPNIFKNVSYFTAQPYVIPAVMQGGSDMTWTVTRWIGANPTAKGFLDGKAAPGGLHVNTYYKGVRYPTNQFTAQDPSTEYQKLFNPVFGLSNVVNYQAIDTIPGDAWVKDNFGNYPALTPEPVGNRALVAIVDQGDAALDGFPVAAIPNTAGRFVQPSDATMAAALGHMTGGGNGTLQMDLANKDPNAYPLTMVIYAMAPTSGLSHAKAAAIARFLDFVAGPGQTPGAQPGQLAPGYLPLTPALRAQTRRDATAIANQTGSTGSGPGSSSPTGSGPGSNPGGNSGGPAGSSSTTGGSGPGSSTAPSHPGSRSAAKTSGQGTQPISLLAAHPQPSAITRFALPALLILGGVAALGGTIAVTGSGEGGFAGQFRRVRRDSAAWGRRARSRLPGLGRKPPRPS